MLSAHSFVEILWIDAYSNFPECFSLATIEFTHAVGSLTFLMTTVDSISISSF